MGREEWSGGACSGLGRRGEKGQYSYRQSPREEAGAWLPVGRMPQGLAEHRHATLRFVHLNYRYIIYTAYINICMCVHITYPSIVYNLNIYSLYVQVE